MILTEKHIPRYFAGLDLGGTFVKGGIVDENGAVLVKDKIVTRTADGFAQIAQDMAQFVVALCKKSGIAPQTLGGVGVGSPGTVDGEAGEIVYSNNLHWAHVPLVALLHERLGVPVFVTNDANAAALGESYLGAGKDYGSMVMVTLGTGVGSGIVWDGKLYEGYRSAGAEVGHSVIKVGGERCTCGRKGCFEAYASATALIRQARRAMRKDANSRLWEMCGGDESKIDGKAVCDAARDGDKTAAAVLKEYIRYLAEGLANIANIFRPEIILLGGGISAAGDLLLVPLRKAFDPLVYGGNDHATVKIGIAKLGNDAGMIGAARFAMTKAGA